VDNELLRTVIFPSLVLPPLRDKLLDLLVSSIIGDVGSIMVSANADADAEAEAGLDPLEIEADVSVSNWFIVGSSIDTRSFDL